MKKISVVIPTIGRMEYLDLAIDSLVKQDIPFDEIILFDNSPTQDTKNRSNFGYDDRIKWVRSGEHLEAIQSWNSAVNSCKNEYVAIFGDDDIALPHFHTEAQRALQRSNFVVLPFFKIDEKGQKIPALKKKHGDMSSQEFRYKRMLGKLRLVVPGVIFRKRTFQEVNGFENSGLPNAVALDDLLWFKITAIEKNVSFSIRITWLYRIHQKQIGIMSNLEGFCRETQKTYLRKIYESLMDLGVDQDKVFPKKPQDIIDRMLITRLYKVTINNILHNKAKSIKPLFGLVINFETTYRIKVHVLFAIMRWLGKNIIYYVKYHNMPRIY